MAEFLPFPSAKAVAFAIIVFAGSLVGGWDTPLRALLLLNVADLVSGILKAALLGKLSSENCGKGALKKLFMWLLVGVAVQIDGLVGLEGHARDATVIFWCVTEAVSIVENAALAGLPVPPVLRQALAKAQQLANTTIDGSNRPPSPPTPPRGPTAA